MYEKVLKLESCNSENLVTHELIESFFRKDVLPTYLITQGNFRPKYALTVVMPSEIN